jgi:energy-coupling factor transporter ATP-binding protein EcfA2
MPFNLEGEGKALGQIQGGAFNKRFVFITDKDSDEVTKNLPTIHIKDEGVFQQVPDPEIERQIIYIFGPSGSGKSTYARKYIEKWQKKRKNGEIFLFSSLKTDDSLDAVKPTRITIGENLIKKPLKIEQFEESLVIFDDIDVIRDKDLKEAVYDILNSILETGRHFKVDCILTNHLPSNGKDTRRILNECHSITYFPHSGVGRQTKYFLENYAGLDTKEIKKLKKLGSRWATIFKTYPMCVMTEKDLFTFDDD